MSKRIDLIIIDPQDDFCEAGTGANDPNRGSLYVDNAENDMIRGAQFVNNFGEKIRSIHVTLDCHHLIDVAHPAMWRNSAGEKPPFFTIISAQDIIDGVWTPIFPTIHQRFIDYCKTLEAGGRYPLCIWPPHCLIGSKGNAVVPTLYEALLSWERKMERNIDWVSKGSNPFTEHYSAVKAEVPDPQDPTTQLNTKLITTVGKADEIYFMGEAGSHCLKETALDIADGFGNDDYVKKMILISDCTSPVTGFADQQTQFIADMVNRGMQTVLSTDF